MRARRLPMPAAIVGAIASIGILLGTPAVASASVHQLSIIQDFPRLLSDPARTPSTSR